MVFDFIESVTFDVFRSMSTVYKSYVSPVTNFI